MSPARRWGQHWLGGLGVPYCFSSWSPRSSGEEHPILHLTPTFPALQEELAVSTVTPAKDEGEELKREEPEDEDVDDDRERVRHTAPTTSLKCLQLSCFPTISFQNLPSPQ